MLRRGLTCGQRVLGPWGPRSANSEERTGFRSRWQRRGPGRNQRRNSRPRALSLRPVNLLGNRAPGMRAPRNTNQFLMREQYRLLRLRPDSVCAERGSVCDMDSYLGALENAHGALLEPAECPVTSPPGTLSPSSCCSPSAKDKGALSTRALMELCGGGAALDHRGGGAVLELRGECSQQYYPSEDDVIQSENFMERDFQEFCSRIVCP